VSAAPLTVNNWRNRLTVNLTIRMDHVILLYNSASTVFPLSTQEIEKKALDTVESCETNELNPWLTFNP
jgi:hypothetical protein